MMPPMANQMRGKVSHMSMKTAGDGLNAILQKNTKRYDNINAAMAIVRDFLLRLFHKNSTISNGMK